MVLDSAKKWWSEADKTDGDGWTGKLSSAASKVRDYSESAASTVGNSAKSAWNSDTAEKVKGSTISAATSIKNGAKSAWNSEAVTSGKATVNECSTKFKERVDAFNTELMATKTTAGASSESNKSWSWWSNAGKTEEAKCDNNKIIEEHPDDKMKEHGGWEWLGNGASTVKKYSHAAVSTIGSSVKSAWDSETTTACSSAVKIITISTASLVGNSANAASEGIKNWWNKEPEKTEEIENSGDSVRGGLAAMTKNANTYLIKTTGKGSGIVKIIDKTNPSVYGKPQWWIRYYQPKVPSPHQQHININKAITGINDPHTFISPTKAKTVGGLGKVAEKANDYAPILTTAAVIYESYRVGKNVKKDYDHGTTRNTIKTVSTTTATYASGSIGAYTGASIGSAIAPGLGTIFGGIAGGLIGGYYGGYYGHVASEKALDHIEWDLVELECKGCKEQYTWKKYQEIEGVCCTPFKSRHQDSSRFWFNKLLSNHDF